MALRLADLPAGPDAARCVMLRAELGLPHDPDALALVSGDGAAIPAEDLTCGCAARGSSA